MKDILPGSLQFADSVQVTLLGAGAGPVTSCSQQFSTGFPVTITPPIINPGGTLSVALCHPITGQPAMPDEVVITFDFYIPEFDANGQPVLSPSCTAQSVNDVKAEGDWTPTDLCDISPSMPYHYI